MPRVRFTTSPKLPRDWADKPYREGWEGEMSEDEAARWVRRGVAVVLADAEPDQAAAAEPDQPEVVEIPDDWRDQHHMARIALARRLTGEEVATATEADEIIAAEAERRCGEDPNVGHHPV